MLTDHVWTQRRKMETKRPSLDNGSDLTNESAIETEAGRDQRIAQLRKHEIVAELRAKAQTWPAGSVELREIERAIKELEEK